MTRNIRLSPAGLIAMAKDNASPAQLVTLDKLIANKFTVTQVLTLPGKCAINAACGTTSGWITHDGVFHRPVKGKKHVAVNTRTLERIW